MHMLIVCLIGIVGSRVVGLVAPHYANAADVACVVYMILGIPAAVFTLRERA
ncbi:MULTISPECIES: hypothetical protein [Acetobacter]|uniref:Uncharacterized protein n=1 Tax=Acetobacter sacchari TaxID=2661687 RepID=A0ABS3LRA3_9PROT|nr:MULTISPECIES: hypothetical protein [Acetobacter]MBO1358452.1 hypothetical protein [Acetobacter sacchari]